jgi:hypothetical protein
MAKARRSIIETRWGVFFSVWRTALIMKVNEMDLLNFYT